jgi:hypothetical protein
VGVRQLIHRSFGEGESLAFLGGWLAEPKKNRLNQTKSD